MKLVSLLRLARTDGVGPITFRRLLERYDDPDLALEALPALAKAAGRQKTPLIPSRVRIEDEIARLDRMGGQFICLGQPNYPERLAELTDPPSVLAVLGDIALLARPSVAMVGARNASANGRRLAEDLAAELAAAGLIVVSGLARGIDTAGHKGALRCGATIAVIAGGLDMPYPPENTTLQAQISEAGAVVAESPLGTAPVARHFPRRNRIIAGLALGTVVVEAALRSGSLITARLANEAGREVFAVPGSPLDPRCRGSNGLIREGATLTETASDVINQLSAQLEGPSQSLRNPSRGHADGNQTTPTDLDQAAREVLTLLGADACSVDDLVRGCQLPSSAVLGVLADLELAGRLEMLPGGQIALLARPISGAGSA